MGSEDAKTLKMKSPEELLANPMADMLKNSPFLLPAQLMALNPQLYAAQFAQLQAAQLMLAKQTLENSQENGDSRKRGAEELEEQRKAALFKASEPKVDSEFTKKLSPQLIIILCRFLQKLLSNLGHQTNP